MKITTISTPSIEPVTVSEQKEHMRVSVSDEDSLIENLITVARMSIENITSNRLITQTVKGVLDRFPSEAEIRLPLVPVVSVDSIKTIDTNGTEAVFSSSNYEVDNIGIPSRIRLKTGKSWTEPSVYREVNGVEITFTCGYGAEASSVPEPLRLAIKLLAAHFYENREATVFILKDIKELPLGLRYLVDPYKAWLRDL